MTKSLMIGPLAALLLKAAEAEGTRRLNAALIGEGGRNLVALEAVRKLRAAAAGKS